MEDDESLAELWREYAFFTREMVRFFKKDDIDMYLTLQEEQEDVVKKIQRIPDDGFIKTEEGQALKKELLENIRFLMLAVQRWLNDARVKQSMSRAYDSLGETSGGHLLNWNG